MPAQVKSVIDDMTSCVREQLVDRILAAAPEEYDQEDLERVQKEDWFLRKFVLDKVEETCKTSDYWNMGVSELLDRREAIIEDSVRMCDTSLKWRKENGVNDVSLIRSGIPRELFTKQLLLIDEHEKTLTIRLSLYRAVSEWSDVYERTARFMLEQFARTAKQGTLIFDLRNVTYRNIDHSIILYLITTYLNHYPQMFSHFVLYEIPWIIKPIARVITALLPDRYAHRIAYCNQATLMHLLRKHHATELSQFFGGSRVLPIVVPEEAPSVHALGSRLNKSKSSTEALAKILK